MMKAMTSLERVEAVLNHRLPDRLPVGLHNFLMACHMSGVGDLQKLLGNGEILAEAQLATWREFGHDLIMHENGVCAEAEAMGCGVYYQPDIPPHVEDPVIKKWEDIDRLEVPDPETTFPLNELLKATRILVKETGGRVFIQGRSDQGPMALASALCGPQRLLLAILDESLRPRILKLIETCTKMNIALGQAQKRAGAHGTTIGAFGSSMISPATYRELEFPGNKAFCLAMREASIYPFVHSCGNETHLLPDLVATGANCLELDPKTDPQTCKAATAGKICVLGMLDPSHVLWQGNLEDVRRHTLETMRVMAPGGGYIMGPGCCLPGDTRPENIHMIMECVRQYGHYAPDGSLPALMQAD